MPIDGLASGLDTNSIIEALMAAERVPVDLMAARQASAKAALDAYKSIESRLAAITTASAALERASGWNVRAATTSNATIATAVAAAGATLGSVQFTVDRLATTHGVATATDVASTSSVVASGGTVRIHIAGTDHDIAVGAGTLSEVATAINDAGIGVRAAIVNTGTGHRLQLTAASSGAANEFSVTSGLDVATAVTTQAVDAKLRFGSGPGAYDVTSATNVFADVLGGVTITAKTVSTEPVTVAVANDVDGLATKVQDLVDAVNAAVSEIKTRTAYDPSSRNAASLAGDSTARQAVQALTRALTDAVQQSPLGSPALAGVSIDRYGAATFDAAKFKAAYAADPAAVERLFVQGGTTTGDVQFVSAGSRAVGGTRNVVVTLAATQATEVGMAGAFPLTVPATIRIKMGSTEIVYPTGPPADQTAVAAGLQAAIDAQGLALTVVVDSGGVRVSSNGYGTAAGFEVDWGTGSYHAVSGTDAEGTIDGVTAVGVGRQLSIPGTDGPLSGLSVLLTSDATGAVGTVDYEPGLAQRLSSAIVAATDSATGYLTAASNGRQSRIDLLTASIDSYNLRLEKREARMRAEFARLEVTLNSLQQQGSNISAQLNSLMTSSSGNNSNK